MGSFRAIPSTTYPHSALYSHSLRMTTCRISSWRKQWTSFHACLPHGMHEGFSRCSCLSRILGVSFKRTQVGGAQLQASTFPRLDTVYRLDHDTLCSYLMNAAFPPPITILLSRCFLRQCCCSPLSHIPTTTSRPTYHCPKIRSTFARCLQYFLLDDTLWSSRFAANTCHSVYSTSKIDGNSFSTLAVHEQLSRMKQTHS